MSLTIATNYHWREFRDYDEAPWSVRTMTADYHEHFDGRFIVYRGGWYDLTNFEPVTPQTPFPRDWEMYCPVALRYNRTFTWDIGLLIRTSSDGDKYQVAKYIHETPDRLELEDRRTKLGDSHAPGH